MTYQAAIFDMDGLLLDTERVCMQAFEQACQQLSLPFVKSAYLKIIGRNAKGIEEAIMNHYAQYTEYAPLRKAWMDGYWPIVETQAIPVKEGVIALLEWFKSQSIPVAVATSTHQKLAATKLRLAGIEHYFEHISSGCEVTNGKPHPEIFLLAAQRLKVAPQACLAFEDSSNGVISALAAEMKVYQVPDLVVPDADIIALGHNIKTSLNDVLDDLQKVS
ncbi:HAD family phosphatase [Psychromonas sp. 14N.309.X.WAT.B.A12]|uniref:HAD family hydrolase n=1 Tax=unclassified Psychromonas TaxID=2614957 RepID=UPI0025B1BD25|nr:HAD family phosphatase [Psychromonas sp. 14N.309.X.WAT.B.A12]MDN2664529.1 HAD family phosphatase [Psychromonas sp. 14N.309.X.WAT.B.A12]